MWSTSSLRPSPSRLPRTFRLLFYCCAVAATIGLCQPQTSGGLKNWQISSTLILVTMVPLLLLGPPAAVDDLSFCANLSHHPSPFPHTWEECVGSGHAALALRSDWQQQLLSVHKELGFRYISSHTHTQCHSLPISYFFSLHLFLHTHTHTHTHTHACMHAHTHTHTHTHTLTHYRRVRFHGLLDDDMSVVLENGSYSFSNIDAVYDYIMSIGMSPSVELSFMPQHLASSNRTYLHYKANTTPPHSYEEWAKVRKFVH